MKEASQATLKFWAQMLYALYIKNGYTYKNEYRITDRSCLSYPQWGVGRYA